MLPAILITLFVCAAFGVGLHYLVLRPLRRQSALAKLVASVGVLLIVQAYVVIVFGTQGLAAPNVLPTDPIDMFGGVVPSNRLQLLALVAVLTAALAVVYRYTTVRARDSCCTGKRNRSGAVRDYPGIGSR